MLLYSINQECIDWQKLDQNQYLWFRNELGFYNGSRARSFGVVSRYGIDVRGIIVSLLEGVRYLRGSADKSLARPGKKQPTATKFWIYSTYSPRSSIQFLTRCSNFCKPLKKNSEGCPSNQVSAAPMTFASDEKWWTFNCFISPGNRW